MNYLNLNLRRLVILAVIISLPLWTINMEQKQSSTPWFDQPVAWLASFIQDSLYGFTVGVRETTLEYLNLVGIKKELVRLKATNDELTTRLLKFQEMEDENQRLKALLEFKQSTHMDIVAAEVIGRDLVPDHNTLTINKGTNQGLKSGQAVLTTQGALGYVFRPQSRTAHVMLMSDRYSIIDGLVQRSRAHGLVEGKGKNGGLMKYLDRSEDVKAGDLVVTGGLDNIFPKGFPLGIVESAEKKAAAVAMRVEIRPVVDPTRAEHVFIVVNAKDEDLTNRINMESNH